MPRNDSAAPAVISSSIRSTDGTPIAYDRSGEGPPVILVDGLVFHRTHGILRPLAAEIAKRGFTVFAYDRRGHGDSGDTEPYSMAREIEDLAIIARLANRPVHLFGASTGAVLALEAANTGLRLRSLALFDTPFLVDDSHPPITDEFRRRLDELIAQDRLEEAMTYYATEQMQASGLLLRFLQNSKTWPQSVAGAGVLGREVGLFADYFQGKPLPKTRWAKVKAPALVMTGSRSQKWLKTTAGALAEVLPDARVALLRGQSRAAKPEPLAQALTDFFSKADEDHLRALRV